MGYYDIQSEDSGSRPLRPARISSPTVRTRPAPRIQNLTAEGWGVLFFAVCSVVFVIATLPTGYKTRVGQWQLALPHLAIVACMAAGLRRLGDRLAVVIGVPLLALSFIVYSLSNLGDNNRDGPQAVAFAVIQGLMIVLATLDLKNNKDRESRPIKLAQRLLGLALPLILLVVAFSVNQHALNVSRR
ncbi:MAG: hypothetical protein ACJ79X_12355 [Gemmatimonadaceae bacterium]